LQGKPRRPRDFQEAPQVGLGKGPGDQGLEIKKFSIVPGPLKKPKPNKKQAQAQHFKLGQGWAGSSDRKSFPKFLRQKFILTEKIAAGGFSEDQGTSQGKAREHRPRPMAWPPLAFPRHSHGLPGNRFWGKIMFQKPMASLIVLAPAFRGEVLGKLEELPSDLLGPLSINLLIYISIYLSTYLSVYLLDCAEIRLRALEAP
jgi:hypothetical protein